MPEIDTMIETMRHIAIKLFCVVTILILQSGALAAFADDIIWYSDAAAAAAMAKCTNRFMLVEISAPWCPSCRALEKMMATKSIGDWTNQRFVCVRVSADTPEGLALMRNFGMDGIPSLLVFDSNGRFKNKMQGGPEDPEGYVLYLTKMAGGESAFANVVSKGAECGSTGGAPAQPQHGSQSYIPPAQPGPQSLQQDYQTPQPTYLPQQRYYQYSQQGYQPQQRYYQYPQQGYSRRKEYRDLLQQGQFVNPANQFQQPGQQLQQQYAQPNQTVQQ